ncbi:MAG TPA: restriction endonuclease [Bacteroidales bacterium]|jgi:hypothetical protein|nr:restriction endonuclease [Bacteroidales bacterium]HOS72522.1 restriction endonuclease [Bacteroidales bacterium]HQH24360.1 restriction endonuclease [Bacteroidales bacterium]HQK70664.1 restriction endonuclease [Bacteroidales bacterium]
MTRNATHHSGEIYVIKANGEKEPFRFSKLESSLRNAGTDNAAIREIINDIEGWIYPGVTTKKIYSRAFGLLKRIRGVAAVRYRLKQAIYDMGPTGYPFEYFIGRIFELQGYSVQTDQIKQGKCVTHEIDVVATNDHEHHLVECKYSQARGRRIPVQTPLYVKSRFDDILAQYRIDNLFSGYRFFGWVVTNNRFSSDSISYGECAGLKLMSWDYPAGHSLKDIIERENIYPITVLTKITNREKQLLLEKGIVTCAGLLDNLDVLDSLHFTSSRSTALLRELHDIATFRPEY